jgi:hypothetical protein
MTETREFRFDAHRHEYIDALTGQVLPHITGMLQEAGEIDDRWFTEESCERGTAVHRLTADYDLGVIEDLATLTTRYKPYLLSHVACVNIVPHDFQHIEEPLVSPVHRFGGRPDRVGTMWNIAAVVEGKTAQPDPSHRVQTALQAILVEPLLRVPAEHIVRYGLYWKKDGKFKLEEHTNRHDFNKAREILRRFAR